MATRGKNNKNNENYIDKNEKLDNGDKYKICDLYLSISFNFINKIYSSASIIF